ncbi:polyprenyl synthetase family protein [Lichenicola sp.]|uniref:polyprenyl synthetase family protein n=1 Tax=Lichenicola sp. TaxID=2804529 RepID=UPI003AFF95D2
MDILTQLDGVLDDAISGAAGPGGPPRLADAMRHAVFPGGARVRPRLCLAVAASCGGDMNAAGAAAAAIELLHCASLVHDDLPCFDDAPLRRGRASVHRAFGQPLAVLAGDALIVLAFEVLAQRITSDGKLAPLMVLLARAAGSPYGLAAGQAWECERDVVLATYHRAKTASLFAAAAEAGAIVGGADPAAWRGLGDCLGQAYQVADDIRDVVTSASQMGKSPGRDRALGRPSAVSLHGLSGAREHLDQLVSEAVASIPACVGRSALVSLIGHELRRLLPEGSVMPASGSPLIPLQAEPSRPGASQAA